VAVLQQEVVGFDIQQELVLLRNGHLEYDTLIIAAGATHSYFGHDEWEALAPGLKTIEDAISIRARILSAFEQAEFEPDAEKREALLTQVTEFGVSESIR
jgi:NADH dehydrogenase